MQPQYRQAERRSVSKFVVKLRLNVLVNCAIWLSSPSLPNSVSTSLAKIKIYMACTACIGGAFVKDSR